MDMVTKVIACNTVVNKNKNIPMLMMLDDNDAYVKTLMTMMMIARGGNADLTKIIAW